jgi:hypothetical protein
MNLKSNTPDARVYQAHTARSIQRAIEDIEIAINTTPSGENRNHLTEANIHLMMAKAAVKKAMSEDEEPTSN